MRHDPRWHFTQRDLYVVIALVVLGALFLGYEEGASRRGEDSQVMGGSDGFDVRGPASEAAPRAGRVSSSLVGVALSESERAAQSAPPPAAAAAAPTADEHLSFKEVAQKSGGKVSAYTASFKKAHPVMKEYSREWMSHPDLKKLNDDYMRDRDPVKFLHGLASSRSFGPLVVKIASDPSTHSLVMDFITGLAQQAPSDLTAAATAVLTDDKTIHALAGNIAQAVGVPASMIPGLDAPPAAAKANGTP